MSTKTKTGPLTGKALLAKLQEIPHLSRREKARECGYVSIRKGGEERVNQGEFLNALLAAKGISVDTEVEKNSRGRGLSYRATVQKNGQIIIGAAYTDKMGLKTGDELEIKVGYKHIRLKQLNVEEE